MTLRGSARRSIPYLVAIMSGFLVAYLLVAFFIFPAHLVTTDTKVPNVVGQTYEAAAAQLQKLGFNAQRGEQRFTAGAASGQVLGQNPLPDAVMPAGTKVVLDVSQGQRTTTVPQIVGMTRQQAELALQSAGLDAGDVVEHESPSPRGQVLSSAPAAGQKTPQPSEVSFVVSGGPSQLAVPDVTGQPYSSAAQLLTQVGFRVAPAIPDSTTVGAPEGTVTGQDPSGNDPSPPGITVRLRVATPSRGP
ncbi:MAG TPA: PASTA domain-containing protein [Gemmatimonadaceae bacterium]|nr:PASTA domain-containing protein [Gemmatimonadaceae bacterium]